MLNVWRLSTTDRPHYLEITTGYVPSAMSQEEHRSSFGRLAQSWSEHLLDMQKVTRSSRVPPIPMKSNSKSQAPNPPSMLSLGTKRKQTLITKIVNSKLQNILRGYLNFGFPDPFRARTGRYCLDTLRLMHMERAS
jgi:hypothetical protein